MNGGVFLRVMTVDDAPLVLRWENDPEFWTVSNNDSPYTLEDIESLALSMEDFRKNGQIRYMICLREPERILGAVDLYAIDFSNAVGYVGILIADEQDRKQGFASKALVALAEQANSLGIKRLRAQVHENNHASNNLFLSLGFQPINYINCETESVTKDLMIEYEKWLKK